MSIARFLLTALLAGLLLVPADSPAQLTALRQRGYSLLPSPQRVELGDTDIALDSSWSIAAGPGCDFAAGWLAEKAKEIHRLEFSHGSGGKIELRIDPGAVKGIDDPGRSKQAYRLAIGSGRIEITGNSSQGLFYGAASLIQLARRTPGGRLIVPEAVITDWPELELRFIHWDTKHHQLRPEAVRRLVDWLALFKINFIGLEIEDKYEYPRHPVIGAPGAYTKSEMQEFTRYALERHIQIVPQVQAPAHFSYVLKHPQFAHLKSDGSNYQACMCDEEAIQLILDVYQDMIDATPGVEYFHASTDEIYYAGICDKCQKIRPYNDANRSQWWVDYVNRVHAWMAERGRKMLCWVEYPLLGQDIHQLPAGLIDAITVPDRDPEWIAEQNKAGIGQIAYTSIQGEELLFPNLFPVEYRGRYSSGRLEDSRTIVSRIRARGARPIGSFCAAWDDSGLHEETFMLGWAAFSAWAWNTREPTVEQATADFMDVYYGRSGSDVVSIYRLVEEGARFFEDGWEEVQSKERGVTYGNSRGKFPYHLTDYLLQPPALPSPESLAVKATFSERYADRIARAGRLREQIDRLIDLINRDIGSVERNRYSLEVLLSLAWLERHFINTLVELAAAEKSLTAAGEADAGGKPDEAVANLVEAGNTVSELLEERQWMWKEVVKVWEVSRYPKNRSVGGRDFLWVMDDVKDHFADRRQGLEYMLAPFQRMELEKWHKSLADCIGQYAAKHGVAVQGLETPRLED